MIHAVILSHTNRENFPMVRQLLESLRDETLPLEITLVESNLKAASEVPIGEALDRFSVRYVQPGKAFGFNEFLCEGILRSKARYLVSLNNDVNIRPGAIVELVKGCEQYDVVSAYNPLSPVQPAMVAGISPTDYFPGYRTSYQFSGWAWAARADKLFKDHTLEHYFPHELKFWFQDNFFMDCLKAEKKTQALCRRAEILHFENQSFDLLADKHAMTEGQRDTYETLKRKRGYP